MKAIGIGFISIVALLLIISVVFGLQWIGVEWRGIIGPKREAVERKIFEETPSFVHGHLQDLVRYRHQWLQADPEGRKGIEATVRIQFARFNPKHVQDRPELLNFLNRCMNGS